MLFSFHCPSCKGKLEADASLSGSQADCPQCGKAVAIPDGRVDAGTTLAGFRLERRLGQGGMGEVYLAQQLSVRRQVAVKILPPGFASNPEAVQRFMHEGHLAAKLDHANIVTVFEAGEDNGHFYLAMAYVEGESLDHRLKRDKLLPEAEALGIIRAMADALAYAWDEFQLLHRDLKPANIMVDRRGRVFLMDLGLAKSLGDESGLTLSGAVIGTPQYMSPEQAQGLADLGVPTDVYALGATLYHLVTGSTPFSGNSALSMLNQHVHAPLPPPRSRNPQVTEGCSRLIETMMAKQPSARYADWRALIADIDRVRQGASPAAAPAVVPPAAGPSGFVLPPAGGPSSSPVAPGPAAVPAVVSKADSGRQAPRAPPSPPRAPPVRAAPPRAAPVPQKRPNGLSLGLTVAVVVVLVLVGVLVAARRGRSIPGTASVAVAPSRPGASVPGQTAATPAALASPPSQAAAGARPTLGQPWTVPDLGLELVWVAAGSFQMGASDGALYVQPVHAVRISRGYWLGKYEVTQAEYEALIGENPSTFKGAQNPVECVSWDDAVAFCAKLTEREQKAGRLPEGYEYRLPTEAEWEYAARGGPKSQATSAGAVQNFTCSGSNNVDEVGWYYGNSGDKPLDDSEAEESKRTSRQSGNHCRTHPVGLKKPNELGLYDMSGNVWEWCLDRYDENYYGRSPNVDPVNTQTGPVRVLRSGSWHNSQWYLFSSQRLGYEPVVALPYLGLRVCLAPVIDGLSASTAPVAAPAKPAPAKSATPAAAGARPALGQPWTVPDLGLELVWVAPGSFQMGSNAGKPHERPVHRVTITKPFWIGKYEVIQAEYEALTGQSPSQFKGARNPVEMVPWEGTVAFCVKLTERERAAGRLPAGYEYRLPTEAEWEYAAQGGAQSRATSAGSGQGYTYSGSNTLDEVAWYKDNSGGEAHPVGLKKPNELGLYDLSGNVAEWCLDWFGDYAKSPGTDPVNLPVDLGPGRVIRGGGWFYDAADVRSAARGGWGLGGRLSYLGFRACLGPRIEGISADAAALPSPAKPESAKSATPAPAGAVPVLGQP